MNMAEYATMRQHIGIFEGNGSIILLRFAVKLLRAGLSTAGKSYAQQPCGKAASGNQA